MKNLLLIGSSGGIGKAILESNIEKYNIYATTTTKEKLKNYESKVNIIEFNHLENQEKELISKLPKIDAVVIASGITSDSLALRLKDELWDKTIQVNLTSIFKILKNVYLKLNSGSSIVLISSVIGSTGNIGQVAYSASKAGLEGMAKTLAREFANKARVNIIAPGFIETEMTKNLDLSKMIESIPLKRTGNVKEVASCVNFLLSQDSSYITGATLHVNGGMLMD